MISRYVVLRRRIEAELDDVRRAAEKASRAFERARHVGQDADYYLDSTAINLHGFYNGIERILEGIARELDGGLPEGPNWHRELLSQMTLDLAGLRPAVLHRETAARLDEYLRFRYVRNLYTWSFDASKLSGLVAGLPEVLTDLEADLTVFGSFLRPSVTSTAHQLPPGNNDICLPASPQSFSLHLSIPRSQYRPQP